MWILPHTKNGLTLKSSPGFMVNPQSEIHGSWNPHLSARPCWYRHPHPLSPLTYCQRPHQSGYAERPSNATSLAQPNRGN